jgi:ankyrin repeat protein
MVKLLIENGAYLSISIKDSLGKTALDYAKKNNDIEIIIILESIMKEKGIKIE